MSGDESDRPTGDGGVGETPMTEDSATGAGVDPFDGGVDRPPWIAAWVVVSSVGVGLVGLAVGFLLAIGGILGLGALGVEATPLVILVVSLALVQGVAFGGVALAYLTVRDRLRDLVRGGVEQRFGVDLGDRRHGLDWVGVRLPGLRDLGAVGLGYGLALGFGIGGAILVSTFGIEAGSNQAAELASRDPTVLLLLIPASFVLIGPGEELLFRGIVQGRLSEAFSAPVAVVLASVIFAAVHYVALSGSPRARLVTVGILVGPALVFGAAYELTDNLVVPALIHGAYNATLFTLLYVALRFGPGAPGGLL
ncbi:MAG: lysostaphin resistance A-like protein [Haloferacaceae archaeon]